MKDELFQKLRSKRLEAFKIFQDPDYSGVFDFIKDLYKKKAHFIYELLQNADDAKATRVKFVLHSDRLVFIHNGTEKFSISDVDSTNKVKGHINSITSIGASTKSGKISDEDLKIGKFGIGFKSVFSFTKTPEIFDDEFCFRIVNYIVPEILSYDYEGRKSCETVFVFPFNNDEKPKDIAYEEIKSELLSLKHPMLFLNSITVIEWQYPGMSGSYSLNYDQASSEQMDETEYRFFTETQISDSHLVKQGIKISRYIKDNENNSHKYSLVFFLRDKSIDYSESFNAYCYFKTEVNPNLRFIIHAPFRITYNRETIKDDEWNTRLLTKLAEMMTDSLEFFKDKALINESLFRALPIYSENTATVRETHESQLLNFGVFQEQLLTVLSDKSKAYFPSRSGNLLPLNKACIARGKELLDLLSPDDLQKTLSIPGADWIFDSLNENDPLFTFLQTSLKARIIASKNLHDILGDIFLQFQSVEWLHKLFAYIKEAPNIAIHFKDKPIVRIEKGTSNVAPSHKNQSKIYLPYENDENANDILRSMGVSLITNELLQNSVTKQVLRRDFEIDLPDSDMHRIIDALQDKFWENQNIEWLIHFYNFVMNDRVTLLETIKYKPVVRIKNKIKNTPPYDRNDNPLAYLPGDNSLSLSFYEDIGFNYIDPQLTSDKTAKKFLIELLNMPEAKDHEVFRNILTQLFSKGGIEEYRKLVRDSKEAKRQYCGFINALVKLVGTVYNNEMKPLFESQPKYPFLVGNSTQGKSLEVGGDLFYPSEDLLDFIVEPDTIWLDKDFYDGFIEDNDSFRILLGYANVNFNPIYDKQRRTVIGLSEYLSRVSKVEQSVRVFNILIRFLEEGIITTLRDETPITNLLNEKSWLFDNQGRKTKPSEVYQNELNHEYNQIKSKDFDHILAVLKFKEHLIDARAEELYKKLIQKAVKNGHDENYIASILDEVINLSSDDYIQLKGTLTLLHKQPSPSNASIAEDDEIDIYGDKDVGSVIEDIRFSTSYEGLREKASKDVKYSFSWFIDLINLEILSSKENARKKDITLYFDKIERYVRSPKMAVITNSSNYIPSVVENLADFRLNLTMKDNTKKELRVDAVSKRIDNKGNHPVHKLLLKFIPDDVEKYHNIQLDEVTSISLNIKDPVFILQELLSSFEELPEASNRVINDEFNFQKDIGKILKNISFIYGPPGTGKTTYIADRLICDLLDKTYKYQEDVSGPTGFLTSDAYKQYVRSDGNLSILVLVPTNKAADVVTQKVMQVCERNGNTNYRDYLVRFETTNSEDIEKEASSIILERTDNDKFSKKHGVVVITTIHRFPYDGFKSYNQANMFKNKKWDLVIFDEASMIPIASMVNALCHIRYVNPNCQLVITGDPYQIPPVQLVDLWSNENIYSMFGLKSFEPDVRDEEMFNAIGVPYPVKNLNTQYRSTASIGELFSRFSYDAKLTHQRSDNRLPLPDLGFKIDDFTIIQFPVNSNNLLFKASRLKKSPYHPYSVLFTVLLIERFLDKLGNLDREVSIGIVSPYRVQADLVGKILATKFTLNDKVKISTATVHGFQGDECDIVICLLNAPAGLYQTTSQNLYVNNQNLLNVAISRARDYLILLIPDENTRGIQHLTGINKIIGLINNIKQPIIYSSEDMEMLLMNNKDYVSEHTFITSHQLVNVYSTMPENEYEFRISEDAVDVQIFDD